MAGSSERHEVLLEGILEVGEVLRPGEEGLLVLEVSDTGAVTAYIGGKVPSLAIDTHRCEPDACRRILVRFRGGRPRGARQPEA